MAARHRSRAIPLRGNGLFPGSHGWLCSSGVFRLLRLVGSALYPQRAFNRTVCCNTNAKGRSYGQRRSAWCADGSFDSTDWVAGLAKRQGLSRAPLAAMPGLRIAMMLESDGPGGAEMMVLRLSEELRRRGHTVIPVGPAR